MNEAGRGDVAILLQRDQQILIQPMDKVRQRKRRNLATGGSSKFDSVDNGKGMNGSQTNRRTQKRFARRGEEPRSSLAQAVTIKFRRSQHGDAVRIMESKIYDRLASLNTPGTGCSELGTRH
jgi:hypothetical protein